MRERKPKNWKTQHSNCVRLGIRCCPSGQNHHTPSNVESPLSARKTTHRTTALLLKLICASNESKLSHRSGGGAAQQLKAHQLRSTSTRNAKERLAGAIC